MCFYDTSYDMGRPFATGHRYVSLPMMFHSFLVHFRKVQGKNPRVSLLNSVVDERKLEERKKMVGPGALWTDRDIHQFERYEQDCLL